MTPAMIQAGWQCLKRPGLPSMPTLGPGMGLAEAYEAMKTLDPALAAKDAEIERLTKQRDVFADTINALEQQRQAAEAEVARLKAGTDAAYDKAYNEGYAEGVEVVDVVAVVTERERCARVADDWLSTPTMKLRAGEMTAQEVRTAKAVVTAIAAAIRAG